MTWSVVNHWNGDVEIGAFSVDHCFKEENEREHWVSYNCCSLNS